MNQVIQFELTSEEMAELEQMLAAMRKANEEIARDQVELEALQKETREIIAGMKERPYVEIPF